MVELCPQCFNARETIRRSVRDTIRRIVAETIHPMPRVLIDTTTGRLYDKQKQAEAFEALPVYDELISSMTTKLDEARIRRAVKKFYQYVMLSHRWEDDGEPLLRDVENISIYDLKSSLATDKLKEFCRLVGSLGFRWAWGDTCCIDTKDNVVLQESLVAMFTWYHGSSLTIVYLRGVSSEPRAPGSLQGSVWNTRGWTYQEYVAAETIRFYTEDWKPYLGLTLSNHKMSPEIISEMQQATGVSAKEMAVLQPGLDRVREKLYVASSRKTTRIEDAAYSLFGIFNVALPVIYGERDQAVGRLLEHILTGSGDVTVLAWTGTSGGYNSCLPKNLTVYDPVVPPHIPLFIGKAEMDNIVEGLRLSLPEPIVMKLHKRLNKLPSPSMAACRLKLPGITCTIPELVLISESYSGTCDRWYIYRAVTSMFGDIEVKTAEKLTRTQDLCLVHPWVRPLLDQEFTHGAITSKKITQTLRLIARLRQPFGALLFEPLSRVFKRVAADSLIMAQISKEVSLDDLRDGICTIEVQ